MLGPFQPFLIALVVFAGIVAFIELFLPPISHPWLGKVIQAIYIVASVFFLVWAIKLLFALV